MKRFIVSFSLLSFAFCVTAETQSQQMYSANGQKLAEFDQQTMSKLVKGISGYHEDVLVEGYWATSPLVEQDTYDGKYPFPIAYKEPWPGKQEFLEKLTLIEDSNKVQLVCMRGSSPSRLESCFVGNSEFHFADGRCTIIWTDAFGPHYVAKYNVKPSHEFYDFVMNLVLEIH